MSGREIFSRITVLIFSRLERYGFFTATRPPAPSFSYESASWLGAIENKELPHYCQAADKILQGYIDVFNLVDHHIGHPPLWNTDPLTGKSAPLVFGKTLDYRNESLVGDIKYLWEPNRHLHLVTLAQAYYISGIDKYLLGIRQQLNSWFEQCPYLMGPQWTSSLELGIRLINWYIVWQLIGGLDSKLFKGKQGESFRDRWLESIYQHVHYIHGHYSRYSSANNHIIGESASVFIATTGWPFWPQFKVWQKSSAIQLEHETLLQNTADGVNREQAIAYQQFVLDFLLLSELTARANHGMFSSGFKKSIENMLEFIASIMDSEGNLPMIGDADDGFVVRLSQEEGWCPYRSLLATGAVLFNRYEFKVKAKHYDDKSKWLLGDVNELQFNYLNNEIHLPIRKDFREGGYYILGDKFESKKEVRIVADAGPLGYQTLAAHGHADALSLTLSAGGEEILIDPGTYTYHTKKKWRNYFRGTSAHNTVRIDRVDQSEIGGNFMWLFKAQVNDVIWLETNDEDKLIASHDGYKRLPDPVQHNRTIIYKKIARKLLVIDSLECNAEHEVELFWHFAEHCQVDIQSGHALIRSGNAIITMKMPNQPLHPRIISGCESPPGGWVSRRFGVKKPITTVVWSRIINTNMEFTTKFTINFTDDSH